jgi:hypothetical protein
MGLNAKFIKNWCFKFYQFYETTTPFLFFVHRLKFFASYILPFNALNTHAMAKNPIPTEANPQPAVSSYLKAPKAINAQPTIIIIKVAHASTVFLFIIFGLFFMAIRKVVFIILFSARLSAISQN